MKNKINKITKELGRFSEGRDLLDWAKDNNVKIEVDEQMEGPAVFNPKGNIIFIGDINNKLNSAIILAHELRHAFQHSQVSFLKYQVNLRSNIISMLIAEADAFSFHNSFAVKAAIETKDAGPLEVEACCANLLEIAKNCLEGDELDFKKLRLTLFKEFFTRGLSSKYEDIYCNEVSINADKLGKKELLILAKEYKHNDLDFNDLKHFGLVSCDVKSGDYIKGKINFENEIAKKFSNVGLESLIKSYEAFMLNNKKKTNNRKIVSGKRF